MQAQANVNATDIEVPQVMQLESSPVPTPIENNEPTEPIVFKDEVRDAIHAKRRLQIESEMRAQGIEPFTEEKEEKPVETDSRAILEPEQTLPQTQVISKENEKLLKDIAYRYNKSYTFMISTETEISLRLHPIIQKCTSPYLIFVNPGCDYDEEVLKQFDSSVNRDIKPMLVYASEEFYICPKFIYEDYQFAPNPFEEINKYVKSITADKCINSKL